jgi:hypothetical protein
MNLLQILANQGEWMRERELCEQHEVTADLVPAVISGLIRRGLVDCRVDSEGRSFKINNKGQVWLATVRSDSTPPSPSCGPAHVA